MSNMISVDLSRAVGSIQVADDAVRRLQWKNVGGGWDVTSLVTPGPKHVVLISTDREIEMTQIAQHLRIWYERSMVLVLRGLIRNDWRVTDGKSGRYGFQKIHPGSTAIVPPDADHPRYHVRHGPDWKDPQRITIEAGSLLLLAAPGTVAEARELPLGVDLVEYLGDLRLQSLPEHLQAVEPLDADALWHETRGGVTAGIYRHHGHRGGAFGHGMVSLAVNCPWDGPRGVHPMLTLAGPDEFVPAPAEHSWCLEATFA